MNNSYALLAILLSAIVTYSLRALPFAIFRDGKMSPVLSRLAMVLPAAIMAVLVVYGLKDTLSNLIWIFVMIQLITVLRQ